MQIETRAQIEIAAAPEAVFDVAADIRNFPRAMRPLGIIPGVASVEMAAGATPSAGAHRFVKLTDGSVVEEEILAFDRPSQHRYRWVHPPAPPFSLVVRAGEGTWSFTPSEHGQGTVVVWTYRFELTSVFAYPVALFVVSRFRRWMEQSLKHVREAVVGPG
jgi:hypothetical protein